MEKDNALDPVATVHWKRIGRKKNQKNDKVDHYTTGVVIMKKSIALILTCGYPLTAIFPGITEKELQEKGAEISAKLIIEVKFANDVSKKGYFFMGGSIEDDLAVLAVEVNNLLEGVSMVEFSENILHKGERLWSIHNRTTLKEDSGALVVDYILPSSFTTGYVSQPARYLDFHSPKESVEYWMPLFGSGSYGAPIFNGENQVVALHSSELQGIQFGVPTSLIKKFIKKVFKVEGADLNEILANLG